MHSLYNLSIRIFGFAIYLFSFFNSKAKLWIDGRKKYFENLPLVPAGKKVAWFHCASLGEFDQALTLINSLKTTKPEFFILVTFFSPSGFQNHHKRRHLADYVCYLPLDTPKNAKKFVRHFKPDLVFFVKYEFWANFIFAAKQAGATIFLVSGIFRKKQHFFKWYGAFFRKLLKMFDQLFIQNEHAAQLLRTIGISNFQVTGDNRFDAVFARKNLAIRNKVIENFLNGEKAFIVGSSWPADEEIVLPIVDKFLSEKKIIIAPHNIKETDLNALCKQLDQFIKYSDLEKTLQLNSKLDLKEENILILDTIGHLSDAYQYCDIAYVGGGFSGNLHNILEPAIYNVPIIFGPKHSKFPEAEMFISEGLAVSVDSQESFKNAYFELSGKKELIRVKSQELMLQQIGATQRIMDYLALHNRI